jgi:hypothetical protein
VKTLLKYVAISVAIGIALTLTPAVLPLSLNKWPIFHWPLLFVDRRFSGWIPLNAGKRVITLFLTNVGVWALLSIPLVVACSKVARKKIS